MNTIHRRINPVTLAILAILCVPAAQAELVNEAWVVRSGDGLYSIARKLAPKDLKLQARIRSEISQLNPGVNTENLEIGLNLKLPVFLFKQPEPAPAAPAALPEAPAPVQVSQPAVVTPDPQEIIGKVVIQSGNMVAENRGSSRKLNRTASILKGDTLKTAGNTRSQIRMKDGALIAISPNTELRIENYAYNGSEDGTERSVINLIKGGFRTITGAIGHVNKQNYQVKTSVATIGIRGTHYGLMLCEGGSCQNNPDMGNLNDGLYGGVVDGSVVADNASGQFAFNNDQYFHIQSQQMPPVETLLPPPVFQDAPPHGGEQPPRDDMANGPKPEGPNGQPPDNQRGMGPDGKGPGPMPGMAPGFQPNGPEGGMMAGDFQFNRNPMGMNFFNNDFLPPRDFQFMPGQPQNNIGNTGLPPPAPPGSGIAIAFTGLQSTDTNQRAISAPIYVRDGNPNGIFLETFTDSSGNAIKNLPFAIHEAHDIIDQNGNIIGQEVHDAVRLTPNSIGADYQNLGGNGTYGVNWGRWQGNFIVQENGAALLHDNNLHFIFSDRLTPKDTLFNLGGLRSKIELYHVIGGTQPTGSDGVVAPANYLPQISATFDFVNHQMLHYVVSVDDFAALDHGVFSAQTNTAINFTQLGDSFPLFGNNLCTNCSGNASLIFVGDNANAAMTSYSLIDTSWPYGISGVALLSQMSSPTASNGSVMHYAFNDFGSSSDTFAGSTITGASRTDNIYLTTQTDPQTSTQVASPAAAIGQIYVPSLATSMASLVMTNPSVAPVEFNTANQVFYQGSPVATNVNWGRWSGSSSTVSTGGNTLPTNDIHFIYSNNLTPPTTLATLIGTTRVTTYSTVVGGSTPTDNLGNIAAGSASFNITANFTLATVDYSVNTTVNSLNYAGSATGVNFTSLATGFNISDNTISCDYNTCSGSATMSFVGSNAEAVLTSFTINRTTPTPTTTSVSGTGLVSDNW